MESNSYLNAGEMKLEKHVSADDRPDNVGISALYELPLGRGKRFLGNARGVLNHIVGTGPSPRCTTTTPARR